MQFRNIDTLCRLRIVQSMHDTAATATAAAVAVSYACLCVFDLANNIMIMKQAIFILSTSTSLKIVTHTAKKQHNQRKRTYNNNNNNKQSSITNELQ